MRILLSNVLVPCLRSLSASISIRDIRMEFIKSLDTNHPSNEKVPSDSWFYKFVGTNYNLGTAEPKKDL